MTAPIIAAWLIWRKKMIRHHRERMPRAALDLALTRNALLAIIPSQQGEPLAHFFELYHRYPAKALNLILQARPVL